MEHASPPPSRPPWPDEAPGAGTHPAARVGGRCGRLGTRPHRIPPLPGGLAMSDTTPTAEIGVTGLAVMGSHLARNFARNGLVTAVHNRSYAKTKARIDDFGGGGAFVPSESSA